VLAIRSRSNGRQHSLAERSPDLISTVASKSEGREPYHLPPNGRTTTTPLATGEKLRRPWRNPPSALWRNAMLDEGGSIESSPYRESGGALTWPLWRPIHGGTRRRQGIAKAHAGPALRVCRVCDRSGPPRSVGPPFVQIMSKYIYVTDKSLFSFLCCVFLIFWNHLFEVV
jgi:hypothetical protein